MSFDGYDMHKMPCYFMYIVSIDGWRREKWYGFAQYHRQSPGYA